MKPSPMKTFESLYEAPWGDGEAAQVVLVDFEMILDPDEPTRTRRNIRSNLVDCRVGRSGTCLLYNRPVDHRGNTEEEVFSIRYQIGSPRKPGWETDKHRNQLVFRGVICVMPEDESKAKSLAETWLCEAHAELSRLVSTFA